MTTATTSSSDMIEKKRFDVLDIVSRFGAFIFLIVLCLIFYILEPAFFKPINIFNVLRQVSIIGLLAIGMTFVILTAGIDLSVGALLALAGLVAAAVEKGGISVLERTPIYGGINRHNLRYVRAKLDRSGHWLMDMISQPASAD